MLFLWFSVPYPTSYNGLRSRPASMGSVNTQPATIQHPAFTRLGALPGHMSYQTVPPPVGQHYNGHPPPGGIPHTHPGVIPDTRVGPVMEGPPAPPSHFEVQRVIGRHSLLLSWMAPQMDELAHSNGVTVKGYKVRSQEISVIHVILRTHGNCHVANCDCHLLFKPLDLMFF